MIRAFLLTLFFCLSASAADDLADAKVAFTNLVNYQKSDDLRALDLFSKHCLVTFTITDGKSERIAVIPPDVFRVSLTNEIAQKHGNKDEYEDVKFSNDGFTVKVSATIHYAKSDKREPFFASYGRDVDDGVMRIERIKITLFQPMQAN
jgi:hypothetical protein